MTRKIYVKTQKDRSKTWKEIKDLEIKDSGSDPDLLFETRPQKTPRPETLTLDSQTLRLLIKYGQKINRMTRQDPRSFDLRSYS